MRTNHDQLEIRALKPEDRRDLTRLAQLDTAAPPPQPVLGGILDGELVAAYSLATGQSVADPFRRTAEVSELLADCARRLNGRRR